VADIRTQNNEGFTILEVITVMVLISIFSIVLVTRLMDTSTELSVQTDVIKTHLRYAQTRAMSSNEIWGVVFEGSTYSLFRKGDTNDKVYFPGEERSEDEEQKKLDLPSGVSANEIVSFDSWGKPYDDASGTNPHPGGQIGNISIIITQNTGYIE
jgi:MSHA pilin protein MshC